MKKISKIVMCIMSTAVIVFLLPLSAVAGYSSWTQTSQKDFEDGTIGKEIFDTTSHPGELRLEAQDTNAEFNAGAKTHLTVSSNQVKLAKDAWSSEAINQQQTIGDREKSVANYAKAQSFKPSIDCTLTKAKIYIRRWGWSAYDLVVYLKADNNGYPGSTLKSKTIDDQSIPESYSWITIDWPDQVLKKDVKYWIYIPQIGNIDFTYRWKYADTNPYNRGEYWTGAAGGEHSNKDFRFKIYEKHYIYQSSGNLISQTLDYEVVPTTFGNLAANVNIPSGTGLTFKTASSADPASGFDTWTELGSGGIIKSDLKRYLKWRAYLTTTKREDATPTLKSVYVGGQYISQPYDCGSDLQCFGKLIHNETLPTGTNITYWTQSAPDNGGSPGIWEEEKQIGTDGQIMSTCTPGITRWIRWKAYLSTTDAAQTPVLHDVTVCWNPYPDAPTLTIPKDGNWTNDNTPLFDWDFNELPYHGDTQEGFHLIIDDSPDFPGVYYDSGLQNSTISQWQFPDGTGYTTIPDGVWYWKCSTKNNYDLWGATSTYSRFQIDTTPPPKPVMVFEPELTPGLQNLVSWGSVGDGDGIGEVKYYVQCSSDSGFAWVTAHSDGWITGTSWNFTELSDGVTYYYRVKAQDALGNQSGYSAPVWSRQDDPVITNYYASPDPFSPNGDGLKDATTIYYTLSRGCTVTVEICDLEGNLKKTLVDRESRSEGEESETWDGKDKEGNTVRNGTYTYRITAEDEKHNIRQKEGKVRVENLVIIESTIPGDNGYFVIGEDEDIKIRFNTDMSSSTITPENIQIMDEYGGPLALTKIAYGDLVTTITPLQKKMRYCTRYTAEISKEVTDTLGNPLSGARIFSFTTLIPEKEVGEVIVECKGAIVKVVNPSETFPGEGKGWYINLVKADNPSLSKYVEGTARELVCYKVDNSGNREDIDELDRSVTISIPYPADIKDKKNLKLYFYNKGIGRWELVKGSGDTKPDDTNYHVTGEVRITNTEYCIRGFAVGALIENYSNYPNPFRAGKEKTTIEYDLEEDAKVTISIYDLLGQLVRRIEIPEGTPERGTQGTNRVFWNGKNERGRVVANGGYYCVIEADTETGKHMKKARKIMVIK